MDFNDNKALSIGLIIKVPTQRSFTENPTARAGNNQQPVVPQEGTYSEHIVQPKENLNILAKKYGTTIDEIKRINNLNSINLSIGQVLKMPKIASPFETAPSNIPSKAETVPATAGTNTPATQPASKSQAPVNNPPTTQSGTCKPCPGSR